MTDHAAQDPSRRDFLYVAAGAMGAVGVAAVAWPFIDQMNPTADVLAEGGPIDVDLSALEPGQQIMVRWRTRPIFVLHRGKEAVDGLKENSLLNKLRDPQSEATQQPDYAANWSRSIKPDYLVVVGICTHLGCIPKFSPTGEDFNLGPSCPGGYFCPCHGSKYDFAGRVYKGVPAPLNLPVPPYHFVEEQVLRVGENPEGSDFDFASIEQI
ncbi:MAG TPA: ubiquinol-cytochrome c reductase iron-sulfur subunit [Alphaproteobacteria bacterium]|nr:ubiquinol-cytochrome c reductase iron-sulfur subunit [Alphaproteobacteria bacterium]